MNDRCPFAGFRPETELILCVARLGAEAETAAALDRWLGGAIDWEYLLALALENRVTTLLYLNLRRRKERVPAEVMARLRATYEASRFHNLKLTHEMLRILELFGAQGIRCLPFKGPTLALALHGDLALRPFWDLDLVIDQENLERAKALLMQNGFEPELWGGGEEAEASQARHCECILHHPGRDVHVELHWHLLHENSPTPFDLDALWARMQTMNVFGRPVPALPPEELLALLSMHGGEKHQWARLRWVGDIAQLVKRQPIDWALALERAEMYGVTQAMLLGLHLAGELLGADLPEGITREIAQRPMVADLAALVRGRLFRADRGLPGFEEWTCYRLNQPGGLNGQTSWMRRIGWQWRYLRAVAKPEWEDQVGLPLSPKFSFLHLFYRPLRFAFKHRARLLRRIK